MSRITELADLEKYELKFFLGNLVRFPQSFMIVGLWYPKRAGTSGVEGGLSFR